MAALLVAGAAVAQGVAPVNRRPNWEVGGGVGSSAGFTGPTAIADLTANGESSGGFNLFSSERELNGGIGVDASMARYFSRTVAVEAGLRYSRPTLVYRLANDVENASSVTAEEVLNRYVVTGSLLWHFRPITTSSRIVPFVAGGGGYVRELHEGNELIETGAEVHAVGGVKYWLGAGRRRFGLRGQAGFSVVSGGFDFRDTPRTLPIASASLLYLF